MGIDPYTEAQYLANMKMAQTGKDFQNIYNLGNFDFPGGAPTWAQTAGANLGYDTLAQRKKEFNLGYGLNVQQFETGKEQWEKGFSFAEGEAAKWWKPLLGAFAGAAGTTLGAYGAKQAYI